MMNNISVVIYSYKGRNLEAVVENLKALADVNITHITNENEITKSRFVDKKSNHMFLRVDEGDNYTLGNSDIKNIKFNEYDIVIVSDYNKGFISDNDLIEISKRAKLSIIDSKRKLTQEMIQYFHFIKLNKSEYNNNIRLNHSGLIVTLGDEGAMLHDGKIVKQKNPQQTIDVSGAGDTFTAAFALSYVTAPSVPNAIKYANTVASKVVSKRGVKTPA